MLLKIKLVYVFFGGNTTDDDRLCGVSYDISQEAYTVILSPYWYTVVTW